MSHKDENIIGVLDIRVLGLKVKKDSKLIIPAIQAIVNKLRETGTKFSYVIFLEDSFLFTYPIEGVNDFQRITEDAVQLTQAITMALDTFQRKYQDKFPLREKWGLESNMHILTGDDFFDVMNQERSARIKRLFKKEFPKREFKREKDYLFFLKKKGWENILPVYMGMAFPNKVSFTNNNTEYLKLGAPKSYKRIRKVSLTPESKQGFSNILYACYTDLSNLEYISNLEFVRVDKK